MTHSCCGTRSFARERSAEGRAFTPIISIKETPDAFRLRVELPGVAREDIRLEMDNHHLRISGERKSDLDLENPDLRDFSESPAGPFSRTVQLSAKVKPDGIKAELADGILTVTLEKTEPGETRALPIG